MFQALRKFTRRESERQAKSWWGGEKKKGRCPSYRDWESQIKGIKRQGPTLGVLFTEVSVL